MTAGPGAALTRMWPDAWAVAAAAVGAAVASFALGRGLSSLRIGPTALNRRGRRVPVSLGLAIGAAGLAAGWALWTLGSAVSTPRAAVRPMSAFAIVLLAGVVDDLVPGGPRGLHGHVASLARGRPTTGILKVIAALLAGALVAVGRFDVVPAVLAVVLMAGSANLWNGLDVVPGRAGKAFVVVGGLLLAAGGAFRPEVAILVTLLAAAAPALWFDLRERAMLGDGGSNLLGFAVGAALATRLSLPGLAVAAALVVALNLLAETVTLSRMIAATPPLRWFDRLGRVPQPAQGGPGETN